MANDPTLVDITAELLGITIPSPPAASSQVVASIASGRIPNLVGPEDTTPRQQFLRAINQAQQSFFIIRYADCDGVVKTFEFSLMPAIESNLRFQSSSRTSAGGGAIVPEVKPGLLKRTTMNVKRFSVPGGPPAIQVLGTEQTIWQLVGTFIGNELYTTLRGIKAQELYPQWTADTDPKRLNAEFVEKFFDEDLVQTGRSVEVHLYSPSQGGSDLGDVEMEIMFRAVLQNVRYFVTRQDRVYYAFDFIVTEYKQCGRQGRFPTDNTPPAEPQPEPPTEAVTPPVTGTQTIVVEGFPPFNIPPNVPTPADLPTFNPTETVPQVAAIVIPGIGPILVPPNMPIPPGIPVTRFPLSFDLPNIITIPGLFSIPIRIPRPPSPPDKEPPILLNVPGLPLILLPGNTNIPDVLLPFTVTYTLRPRNDPPRLVYVPGYPPFAVPAGVPIPPGILTFP